MILAAAGADFFDGLEWCRTVADRKTGFLFHHQQFDFFKEQSKEMAASDFVRNAVSDEEISLLAKMAMHNLDFFNEWMNELQSNIHAGRVGEMIHYHAAFSTREFVDELKRLIPDLFS